MRCSESNYSYPLPSFMTFWTGRKRRRMLPSVLADAREERPTGKASIYKTRLPARATDIGLRCTSITAGCCTWAGLRQRPTAVSFKAPAAAEQAAATTAAVASVLAAPAGLLLQALLHLLRCPASCLSAANSALTPSASLLLDGGVVLLGVPLRLRRKYESQRQNADTWMRYFSSTEEQATRQDVSVHACQTSHLVPEELRVHLQWRRSTASVTRNSGGRHVLGRQFRCRHRRKCPNSPPCAMRRCSSSAS